MKIVIEKSQLLFVVFLTMNGCFTSFAGQNLVFCIFCKVCLNLRKKERKEAKKKKKHEKTLKNRVRVLIPKCWAKRWSSTPLFQVFSSFLPQISSFFLFSYSLFFFFFFLFFFFFFLIFFCLKMRQKMGNPAKMQKIRLPPANNVSSTCLLVTIYNTCSLDESSTHNSQCILKES